MGGAAAAAGGPWPRLLLGAMVLLAVRMLAFEDHHWSVPSGQALARAEQETRATRGKISGVRSALARERVAVARLKQDAARTLGDMGSLMQSTQHEVGVVGAPSVYVVYR